MAEDDDGAGGVSASSGATGSEGGDMGSLGGKRGVAGQAAAGADEGGGMSAAGGTPSATGGAGGGSEPGGSSGKGGTPGHAGSPGTSGGSTGIAGGTPGEADCVTLKAQYAAAVEKARVCDKGSVGQCEKDSTLPAVGCGCPTLVNPKSEYTALAQQKYQALQDKHCLSGAICNVACAPYAGAMCSAQTTTAGTAFVCSGSSFVTTN